MKSEVGEEEEEEEEEVERVGGGQRFKENSTV